MGVWDNKEGQAFLATVKDIGIQSKLTTALLGVLAENQNKYATVLKSAAPATDAATKSLRESANTQKQLGAASSEASLKIKALIAGFGGYLTFQGLKGLASAASPNGMQSVDSAFDLLAGTIGSIILPGFVALGGAAIMAADRVQAFIDKHLDSIIDAWATAINSATIAVQGFKFAVEHPGKAASGAAAAIMLAGPMAMQAGFNAMNIPGLNNKAQLQANQDLRDMQKSGVGMQGGGPASGVRGPGGMFGEGGGVGRMGGGPERDRPWQKELADNMRMITRDMQMSIGRPSLTDPVGKWKEAALQIQQSELEMRKLDMQQKAIDASNRLADALEKKAQNPNQVAGPVIGGRIRVP